MNDRYFYHSFRRIRPDEDRSAAIKQTLSILEAMEKIGLILAPEVVTWDIPLADQTTKRISYRQRRICFTELSRQELPDHARKFGPVSLEFSVDILRRAAALPVFYIPQMVPGDRLFSSTGPVMVWMFQMIRHTLDQLERLRQFSDPETALQHALALEPSAKGIVEDHIINLQNREGSGPIDQEFTVSAKTVRGILNYLGYKTAPFAMMHGATYAAQALFYPTDDEIHDELLAYYRQREWRLIPGIAASGVENARPLSVSEKKILVGIDERFWTRELTDDGGTFRRIDDAHAVENIGSQRVRDAIRAVLVPSELYEPTRTLFGNRVAVLRESEKA